MNAKIAEWIFNKNGKSSYTENINKKASELKFRGLIVFLNIYFTTTIFLV